MSIKIETFIRKLNNTELDSQSTNDAYVRVSREIQDFIPATFFTELESKKCKILIKYNQKKDLFPTNKWLRYQFYPANGEYRIVSLTEIYDKYSPSAGDYIIIEKKTIIEDGSYHYEVSMRKYDKISMKYNKKGDFFEILNLNEVVDKNILEKEINLKFEGEDFASKISFALSKKKKKNSPKETNYYNILNLPNYFMDKIKGDPFVEIVKKGGNLYLSIEKSWNYDIITRDNE